MHLSVNPLVTTFEMRLDQKDGFVTSQSAALHSAAAAGTSSGGGDADGASGHWAEYGTPHHSSFYTLRPWVCVLREESQR